MQIVKKKPKDRTQLEFFQLTRLLESTDLYQSLKRSITDEASLSKILFALANNLEIEKLPKNKIVFKIGEPVDKFYIVIQGKVSKLRPKEIGYELTQMQYLNKLNYLLHNKEHYLLNKTIVRNYNKIQVDLKDLNSINDFIFYQRFKKIIDYKPAILDIKKLFKEFNKDPLHYCQLNIPDLQVRESFDPAFEKDYKEILLKALKVLELKNDDLSIINRYNSMEQSKDILNVVIFENEYFFSIRNGQHFGDIDQTNKSRSFTIIGEADISYIGCIKHAVYQEFVLNEKEKIKAKEVQFLIENYFFRPVKVKTFVKRFFKDFEYEEVDREKILFKEKDVTDYIYFIKEGDVELLVNKSIIDVQKWIRSSSILDKDTLIEDYKSDNDPRNYMDQLTQNQILRIYFYGAKEMLGAEEYFYNLPRLYTAKVSSEKLRFYKISCKVLIVCILIVLLIK